MSGGSVSGKTISVQDKKIEIESTELKICSHCGGKGRLSDTMPKSQFPALDWLSVDGEICNNCRGTGKALMTHFQKQEYPAFCFFYSRATGY